MPGSDDALERSTPMAFAWGGGRVASWGGRQRGRRRLSKTCPWRKSLHGRAIGEDSRPQKETQSTVW